MRYLLARRRRSCARDELLEEFWPDTAPSAARNRLQAAVSGVRRTFRAAASAADVIEHHEGEYRIGTRFDVDVDVDRFERSLAVARERERAGRPQEALVAYHEAVVLHRGHFAQDAPDEGWTLLPRESHRLAYGDALDRSSCLQMEAGRLDDAIATGHRMLDLDPCHEEAHELLMRCFLQQGRTHQAIRQFEFCARVLAATIDAKPGPGAVALYRAARSGGPPPGA